MAWPAFYLRYYPATCTRNILNWNLAAALLLLFTCCAVTGSSNQQSHTPNLHQQGGFLARKNPLPVPTCKVGGGATVTFSANEKAKYSWKGWGTSLCWFANFIGGLPVKQLTVLLDLLFSKTEGLGLNIVRYNIGGGFNPTNSPQFVTDTWQKYKVLPSFKPTKDGPYDWTADERQRTVLLGAKRRGANTFVAFSNSPPDWQTISGDVAGSIGRKANDNLSPENYEAFADYLTDVVREYRDNPSWNVTFQFLEPVNEGVEGWWHAGGSQEGCNFSPGSMSRLYPIVAKALSRKNLTTQIVGIDSGPDTSARGLARMDPAVVSSLHSFQVHGYIRPTSEPGAAEEKYYSAVADLAERFDEKEVWMSEWGPRYSGKAEMSAALSMATSVTQSVNFMGASSWSTWQAIGHYPQVHWGFIQLNWENVTFPMQFHLPKMYHVMRQFTSNVPPGSFVLKPKSSSDCRHGVAAWLVPGNATSAVSIFVTNQEPSSRQITISLQDFGFSDLVSVKMLRTSLSENGAASPAFSANASTPLTLTYIPRSVTTLLITQGSAGDTVPEAVPPSPSAAHPPDTSPSGSATPAPTTSHSRSATSAHP